MSAAAGVLPPALAKEIRALLPTFTAALGSIAIGCVSSSYLLIALGLLGFAFGSVALGAQSFGLEYSHGTLGLLLSQPIDRRRVFCYKLAVLSVMLVTLTVAILVLYNDLLRRAASPHTDPSMLMLAAACALFVAPTLTMICRSTLAGIVFTVGIPGLLSVGADVVGALRYGLENAAAIDRFRLLVFWRGMLILCALGAVASWRMFMRLEVIEGHSHLQFAGSAGKSQLAAPARPHWAWALLMKELRVQQMTFVVAVLFALMFLSLAWLERSKPDAPFGLLVPVTLLYSGMLGMLIGSLSSAEERHFGTLEWQILQPIPAWQQWAIKVGVVFGLVLALGVGLPLMLGRLLPSAGKILALEAQQITLALVLLTSGTIYVSTLCKSGVSALVWSFAAVAGTTAFVGTLGEAAERVVIRSLLASGHQVARVDLAPAAVYVIGAGFVAVLLTLGFVNHASTERGARRTSKQVLGIAGYIVAGVAVFLTASMR